MNVTTPAQGINHPFALPAQSGQPVEIAANVFWLRLPLPFPPHHVNACILVDTDGLTIIDPGVNDAPTRALWEGVLAQHFPDRPIARVLITHHHVDHIGLAGWFHARGAELLMTRTSYFLARALWFDYETAASDNSIRYWTQCGLTGDALARRIAAQPHNLRDMTAPLPPRYTRLREGDSLHLAGRDWTIRCGDGHAAEHATLWSEDLVIAGDTMLPGISPNIGAWPSEPEADTLGDWLASCAKFLSHANAAQLVLPGHKLPYTGLPFRLQGMIQNHHGALSRLHNALAQPMRVIDCFQTMFARQIGESEVTLALAETLAHLTRLRLEGRVSRISGPDGAWLWQALPMVEAQD